MRLRLAASAALGVALVVGLVAVLGPVVAGQVDGRPVDPRRYVEPPQVQTLDENPLIRISGWALHPEQKLLDVSTRTLRRAGSAVRRRRAGAGAGRLLGAGGRRRAVRGSGWRCSATTTG